jgi:hypothetical protein
MVRTRPDRPSTPSHHHPPSARSVPHPSSTLPRPRPVSEQIAQWHSLYLHFHGWGGRRAAWLSVGRKAKVHERETRRNKVVELASEASSAEWDERVGWRKGTVVVEER